MPNRLIHETSPYLLQHAHNPVDWYPWGKEALQKARAENKVILVSIGYSACHWCHVMERESFENEDTAALMNDYFVNIKIDREERPDLDQVYMDAVQLLSGSGGWPLNCFLTPDAKPFYGGTYFPPVHAYNRSSWTEVMTAVNQAWLDKPQELIDQANSLLSHLENSGIFSALEKPDIGIHREDLQSIAENLLKSADTVWGGFGRAPKFPQTFSIGFLLRQAWLDAGAKVITTDAQQEAVMHSPLTRQALLSLDKMIMGGIYDQLGGGFARYSTDAQWLAPHFEKMLYDNALLLGVIAEAFQITGKPLYKQVMEQTMEFIAAYWQDTDGGFFSAFDADSEGEEGKFYTWSKREIEEVLADPEAIDLFLAFYGITAEGNWEHTNILWVQQPLEIFCKARSLDAEKSASILGDCRQKLLAARSQRIMPLLDDKKLFSWNAMMITACCKCWAALGNDGWLQMAERAAEFIEQKLKAADGEYRHNYKNGFAANPAFLDDMALYIEALCHLQECTGKAGFIEAADSLCGYVLAHYLEQPNGLFYYTKAGQPDIVLRKKEIYDGATASGNSLMAANLFYLGILLNKSAWKAHAVAMAVSMKKLAASYSTSFALWAQLMQQVVYGVNEVAIVGEHHAEFAASVFKKFWPNKIMQHQATNNESYPFMAGRAPENDTKLYLCSEYQCSKPVQNPDELFRQLNASGTW